MGIYVNPGNQAFRRIATENYVDKTGLIEVINERVGGGDSLICVSRSRRFGKSYAAKMLTAYYDCSCDSHDLFDDKAIAHADTYETFLNKYHVICLDVSAFVSEVGKALGSIRTIPVRIEQALWKDLLEAGFSPREGDNPNDFLIHIVEDEGRPFLFILDEWDAPIRESKGDIEAQRAYLDLLRGWFKNTTFTPRVVAAAYMTGILPVKKEGTQSAIPEFDESSMLQALEFAPFVGFTQEKVRKQCQGTKVHFEELKKWYDGYGFPAIGHIYNPYCVMKAIRVGRCQSYWRRTSAAQSLRFFLNMDFEGLQETIARLITGEQIPVVTDSFQNDLESFESADDVFTLLVHLGYLTYHEEENTVQIPNEEVRLELKQFLSQKG